jgi:hypothetical protein
MDIIWILLAMALLYGLPELLRKKPRQANEYPQFPDKPVLADESPPNERRSREGERLENKLNQMANQSLESNEQSQYVQMTAAAPTIGLDERPFFSSQQVITGVVWAQILAKPKTVKPFPPQQKH